MTIKNADKARLKCNREKSCQNCAARDERTTCKYRGSKNTPTPIAHDQNNREDSMQRRIDNLEDLVKRLITQGQVGLPENVANQHSPVAPNTSDVASIADTGSTVIDGVHSVYKVADD
jgi:hypothetical protein